MACQGLPIALLIMGAALQDKWQPGVENKRHLWEVRSQVHAPGVITSHCPVAPMHVLHVACRLRLLSLLHLVLQGALQALQVGTAPNVTGGDGLNRVLSYSFNKLNPAEKAMFLDVAAILHGQPKAVALAVWEAWQDTGEARMNLANLERRCLLMHTSHGQPADRLTMHDVLRFLGRGILRGTVKVDVSTNPNMWDIGSRLFVSARNQEYKVFGDVKVS